MCTVLEENILALLLAFSLWSVYGSLLLTACWAPNPQTALPMPQTQHPSFTHSMGAPLCLLGSAAQQGRGAARMVLFHSVFPRMHRHSRRLKSAGSNCGQDGHTLPNLQLQLSPVLRKSHFLAMCQVSSFTVISQEPMDLSRQFCLLGDTPVLRTEVDLDARIQIQNELSFSYRRRLDSEQVRAGPGTSR